VAVGGRRLRNIHTDLDIPPCPQPLDNLGTPGALPPTAMVHTARAMTEPPTIHHEEATADSVDALYEMLTYAAYLDGADAIERARRDPDLALYVDGFGRPGDLGVVARLASGEAVGAAWVRLSDGRPARFRVATASEPELAIGVRPGYRGGGVGRGLLDRVLALAAAYPAVVLSVRSTNPSARLYERAGFVTIERIPNRVGGESLVMRRPTPAPAST
jgi:ribosomal protein S18 acetylase RimI-like enzyme